LLPARDRVAGHGLHLHLEREQVVAALDPVAAVADRVVEEELRLEPLAHEPALHVGERDDDRVDRAALHVAPQLLDAQHAPILAGCLTSYAIAFNQGGPVAITWGWLIVGLFCTIVALAMGEIASTYPTAGGLYYWASKLGTPGWGWFTGWFNLVGQIAVTASI